MGEWQSRPGNAAYLTLEGRPEPRNSAREMTGSGLTSDSPELHAESARIVSGVAPVIETRHVNVLAAYPVVVGGLAPIKLREKRVYMDHDLLAEVLAYHAGSVSDARGIDC